MGDTLSYRRLRAPQEHGTALIDPPADHWSLVCRANEELFEALDCDIAGRSLKELRQEAQRELLCDAIKYTAAYRDVGALKAPADDAPLILSGHQPQLFHSGVWFKMFALSACGRAGLGVPVNLIIDNDVATGSSLRVPTGQRPDMRLETVAFDGPGEALPYEARTIRDRQLFQSFGQRVKKKINPLVADPLIGQLWPLAIEAASGTANPGRCLAQARHRVEESWGLHTLELPLSRACQSHSFLRFVVCLLFQAARFQQTHNAALHEYRRVNRVRSHAHPVPDLAREKDGWLETPFWIWTSDAPQRQRLFVRQQGGELRLTNRSGIDFLVDGTNADLAVEQLESVAEAEFVVRPRALITTMYARLVLSTLFLHGIGGAKYDQLTDAIVARFFGFAPPPFLTLTATACLPVELPDVSDEDLLLANARLRQLRFHPERFLDARLLASQADVARLVEQKKHWIAARLPRGQGIERHRGITRINAALQPHVVAKRQEIHKTLDELTPLLREKKLLASREFSFCLFPEKTLRPLLLELSSGGP